MHPSSPLLQVGTLTLLASLRTVYAGIGFDCKNVVDDRVSWDLSPLGGVKTVHWIHKEPPSITNMTFTIDICKPLKRLKDVPAAEQCDGGTRICGVEQIIRPDENTTTIDRVIPIAGEYTATNGRHLESRLTRLKDSDSNANADMEGVRVELSGSRYPMTGKPYVEEKAIIEFICDPDVTGNEGSEADGSQSMRRRRDEEDDGDVELDDPDKGKSVKFISYKEQANGDAWALRLEWRTKYACENAKDIEKPANGGWGFFTWFIIVYDDLPFFYVPWLIINVLNLF